MTEKVSAIAAMAAALTIVLLSGLAFIKVRNELQMTKAYDRQAAALEIIAEQISKVDDNQIILMRAGWIRISNDCYQAVDHDGKKMHEPIVCVDSRKIKER